MKKLLLTNILVIFIFSGLTQSELKIIRTLQSEGNTVDRFFWENHSWLNDKGNKVIYQIDSISACVDSCSTYFIGQKAQSQELNFNSYYFELELSETDSDSIYFLMSGKPNNKDGVIVNVFNSEKRIKRRHLKNEKKISHLGESTFLYIKESKGWQMVKIPVPKNESSIKLVFTPQNKYDRFYVCFDKNGEVEPNTFQPKISYIPATFELITYNLYSSFEADTALHKSIEQIAEILKKSSNPQLVVYLVSNVDFDRLYTGPMSARNYGRTDLVKSTFEGMPDLDCEVKIVGSDFQSYDLNSVKLRLIGKKDKIWVNY